MRSISLSVLLVALVGCPAPPARVKGAPTTAPAPQPASAPLIPRSVLFGSPEKRKARLSPDGKHLSYLAPVDGVLNIWVGPADAPSRARPLTRDAGRGIHTYRWTYSGRHLLYRQDQGGDENYHVYALDVVSGAARDLTPIKGVQARIVQLSPQHPGAVLLGINDRDRRLHDLHRVELATGRRTPVLINKAGYVALLADHALQPRLAVQVTRTGGFEILLRKGGAFVHLETLKMEEATGTMEGFDATGRYLYVTGPGKGDKAALVRWDVQTNKREVLARDDRADLTEVLYHPRTGVAQAAAATHTRKRWQAIDPALKPVLARLAQVAPGDFEVVSRTLDDRQWVVVYDVDTGPLRYYVFDTKTRQARFLFSDRPALGRYRLAPMHPVVIKARDGLELVCYLTLPPGAQLDAQLRTRQRRPLVLYVHGGPWARDSWGYSPRDQWMANRGYAVLRVNYRGSTGFGKRFVNAGNKQWAGKMHDDLLDALAWARRQGIVDPRRVAIMGGSYGGYAVLVGMSFTPQHFACGVERVGFSNLVTYFGSVEPHRRAYLSIVAARVADPRTKAGRAELLARSPISRIDKIARPLLIGQGQNDPRVRRAESDRVVAALQQRKVPVTYLLYRDEGHIFVRPETRRSFNAVAEAFLARCLGGRVEPLGDALRGANLEVPAGAGHVEGLAEALKRAREER